MGVSVALAMSPPLAAHAAIYTWNGCGADGNWNTPGNWAGDLQPSSSDSLLFAGCVRTTNSNNIASGKFAGISYDTSAGAFLTTGNSLALNGNLTDSSTAAETLNLAISVSGASTIIVANGGRLVFGSTATSNPYNVDPGGTTATFAGATAGSGEIDILSANDLNFAATSGGTLNMANLGTFTANVANFNVASGMASTTGVMNLGGTNSITATSINIGANVSNIAGSGAVAGNVQHDYRDHATRRAKEKHGHDQFRCGTREPGRNDQRVGRNDNPGRLQHGQHVRLAPGTVDFTGGTVNATLGTLILGDIDPYSTPGSGAANAKGTFIVDGTGSVVNAGTAIAGYWNCANTTIEPNSTASGTLVIKMEM